MGARRKKSKESHVKPICCVKNMFVVKYVGYGKRGFFWRCAKCGEEFSTGNGRMLTAQLRRNKLTTNKKTDTKGAYNGE